MVDIDNTSEILDRAYEVITPPPAHLVGYQDQDELLTRLSKLQTPNERLWLFLRSLFDVSGTGTYEGYWVRNMSCFGLASGWLFGGFFKTYGHYDDFVRQHNTDIFDNKHRAARLKFDSYTYSVITKGMKYGLATGTLMCSVGLVSLGSINYRNKLYLPDWLVGFATIGALSRCWLGMRGLVSGGVLGTSAGLFGYGIARSIELALGESVTQMRHLNHESWSQARQKKLERMQRVREVYEQRNPRL